METWVRSGPDPATPAPAHVSRNIDTANPRAEIEITTVKVA
jgi:hypothetical protein